MAKSQDARKNQMKPPQKTLEEKRKAKREKKLSMATHTWQPAP